MEWTRYRFRADPDDYRPIIFPPPGPYWCSGYGFEGDPEEPADYSIVIAWFPIKPGLSIQQYWPEATHITMQEDHGPPVFTDRFPKPDWWKPEEQNDATE